jgi:hypothetical protein
MEVALRLVEKVESVPVSQLRLAPRWVCSFKSSQELELLLV